MQGWIHGDLLTFRERSFLRRFISETDRYDLESFSVHKSKGSFFFQILNT